MASRAQGFVGHWGARVTKKKIELPDGSFLERMTGKPGDGSNSHCAILDEAHENDSDDQRLTMKTGMERASSPCWSRSQLRASTARALPRATAYSEQILSGELNNPRHFSAIIQQQCSGEHEGLGR